MSKSWFSKLLVKAQQLFKKCKKNQNDNNDGGDNEYVQELAYVRHITTKPEKKDMIFQDSDISREEVSIPVLDTLIEEATKKANKKIEKDKRKQQVKNNDLEI